MTLGVVVIGAPPPGAGVVEPPPPAPPPPVPPPPGSPVGVGSSSVSPVPVHVLGAPVAQTVPIGDPPCGVKRKYRSPSHWNHQSWKTSGGGPVVVGPWPGVV